MAQTISYCLEHAVKLRQKEPEYLERQQLMLFRKHFRHACRIPFYKELFETEGIDVSAFNELKDISSIPFTTRIDIDKQPLQFGVGDYNKISDIAITSGTTGEPVIVPYTEGDLKRLAFNEAVGFYGAGVEAGDSILLTVTLDRCFIAGLAYYSGAVFLGASAIRSGPGQPERQWNIIEKLKPRIIVGVPTFLKELGEWGVAEGKNVPGCSIDTLITIGEPARRPNYTATALGHSIEELWGAKMFSSYGATEFETAFCECRESAGGHVHPELMLVEIIDDSGRVVEDGSPGEVVVTPLGVEGFPLVRFRTGDISRLDSSPCGCGWNTKRLGPIEGRLAQRLKYKGTTLYPETIFHALQDILNVRGAYVEVRSTVNETDDITVVVGCDDPLIDVRGIEEKLQAHIRVRPAIKLKRSEEVFAKMSANNGRKPLKFFDLRRK